MSQDRKDVLLKAAYDLLQKQNNSSEFLYLLGETVVYDGVESLGFYLMDDIEAELNLINAPVTA